MLRETNTLILRYSKVLGLCSLLLTLPAQASMRHYQAGFAESQWMISQSNRLQCTLDHPIPGYGKASFTSVAGKTLNMVFDLDMYRLPNRYGAAEVYSVPPRWLPGQAQRLIADMPIRRQFDGDLPEQAAWTMLTELEKGFLPTIYYQDWRNAHDQVTVGLSAVNFTDTFGDFNRCVANLLPFSFDDIAFTVLTYEFNSNQLTKYSQRKLEMIGEYLMADPNLELVLLDGYTDSHGSRSANKRLSVDRAVEVKSYFRDLGVESTRIDVTGHGERRHASPNDTEFAREKNRRVVIRMSKS